MAMAPAMSCGSRARIFEAATERDRCWLERTASGLPSRSSTSGEPNQTGPGWTLLPPSRLPRQQGKHLRRRALAARRRRLNLPGVSSAGATNLRQRPLSPCGKSCEFCRRRILAGEPESAPRPGCGPASPSQTAGRAPQGRNGQKRPRPRPTDAEGQPGLLPVWTSISEGTGCACSMDGDPSRHALGPMR